MQVLVNWSSEVIAMFPQLAVCVGVIENVNVEINNAQIETLKKNVYDEVKGIYDIETLKDNPTVRAYRDFYWKLDIDPTKTRPSGEALLRRVLHGEKLPQISNAVDAYNLASMKTIVPISGFDKERLAPPFQVRFSRNGEVFAGIGMSKPMNLTDRMLVFADEARVLCIYPYRDSDHTKIMLQTKKVIVVGYGAPKITEQQLREAVETTLEYIKMVSDGKIEMVKVFSSTHQ